jgi:hypothetical protein
MDHMELMYNYQLVVVTYKSDPYKERMEFSTCAAICPQASCEASVQGGSRGCQAPHSLAGPGDFRAPRVRPNALNAWMCMLEGLQILQKSHIIVHWSFSYYLVCGFVHIYIDFCSIFLYMMHSRGG